MWHAAIIGNMYEPASHNFEQNEELDPTGPLMLGQRRGRRLLWLGGRRRRGQREEIQFLDEDPNLLEIITPISKEPGRWPTQRHPPGAWLVSTRWQSWINTYRRIGAEATFMLGIPFAKGSVKLHAFAKKGVKLDKRQKIHMMPATGKRRKQMQKVAVRLTP